MFELKVTTDFAGAHQLKMVGEKCENLHGHNWKIEVFVMGEKLNKAGVLIDFGIIKKHLKDIIKIFDHRFLNELDEFTDNVPPSSENIAYFIGKKLEELLKKETSDIFVSRVTAWESGNSSATWIADI